MSYPAPSPTTTLWTAHLPSGPCLHPTNRRPAVLEQESREGLLNAASCLSRYARSRSGGESEFGAEFDDPWFRTADFLDEISEDLRDGKPIGERAVEWATLLTMVADHLDLYLVDEDFHTLVFVFIEACLLVHLEWERVREGRFPGGNDIRERIRSRLDFIVGQLDPQHCFAPGAAA